MEFDISYTSKEITPWGGMVFLKQMLQNMGFRELIENNTDLSVSGSNRGYKTSTIIEGFITSIWCRANRFLHTEVTRHDAALGKIFDWKNTPGQDTYKRFFSKFTQTTNQKVSDSCFQRWDILNNSFQTLCEFTCLRFRYPLYQFFVAEISYSKEVATQKFVPFDGTIYKYLIFSH